MKTRCKYEYQLVFGSPRHTWSVIGATAGIHLWISDQGEGYKYERYAGGIEIHYRYPPEYMRDDPPSHDECWLLKCPCWHDGSSLQVSEYWIPFWLADTNNHDRMFEHLSGELATRNCAFMGMVSELAGKDSE